MAYRRLMWCTRWFLPLLLLPLPTAPPYFLILFLLSLTIHAKPCFYCIVLLTTLFISSCYWQPFPIDSPLTVPWADNITTFAQALNATISPTYSRPLPTVMRVVDRCWCDFSVGSFFEPFNVSHWENISITRLSHDLERQQQLEDAHARDLLENHHHTETEGVFIATEQESMPAAIGTIPTTSPTTSLGFWSRLKHLTEITSIPVASESVHALSSTADVPHITGASVAKATSTISPPQVTPTSDSLFSFIHKEYDLHPYGLGMVIDLRWS
ncbi:hypothetical protein BDN70DRAFT_835600 [Pholiota conissans]|uniref:Uncharacterized protein n=1 Tax=Pholiota conissans TaxID=109636 RepID=A0A9P5Z1U6_9AGAR|nr:hypothetical protein BDN70DRAFT_835600 [Pholiota conissans]